MLFRRVLGAASAMVLVLIAALAVLQVRSWRTYDTHHYDGLWEADPGRRRFVRASVSSENGYVTIHVRSRLWDARLPYVEPPGWRYTSERPSTNTRLVRANIDQGWVNFQGPVAVGFGEERWYFNVRYALMWLVMLPLPVPYLLGVARRRRRRVTSRCVECGYDLCASRERCPECATPIPGPPEFLVSRVHPAAALACAACVAFTVAAAALLGPADDHFLTAGLLLPWLGLGIFATVCLAVADRVRPRRGEQRYVVVASAVFWMAGWSLGAAGVIDKGFGLWNVL